MGLAVDYREVVVLRHFAELSYAEMSVALAIPEKTVKSRLYTARQKLAEILGGGRAR
jgi:RNA polymerase sigma-70 factor (ECF subfamily)